MITIPLKCVYLCKLALSVSIAALRKYPILAATKTHVIPFENILVRKEAAKSTDFGMSRIINATSSTNNQVALYLILRQSVFDI
ncbi:7649_t:CDS:2, partial [Ambispora gerdemannii]